jgi:hypothetical protein
MEMYIMVNQSSKQDMWLNYNIYNVYVKGTNGKHQWVPKDVIEAAEKHAKVCFLCCFK